MNKTKTSSLELISAYGGDFLIPLGDACIGNSLKISGQFETDDIKIVTDFLSSTSKRISNKSLFIDVGANIGTHSVSALKDHGYSKVFAIEPSAENYRLLTSNLCLNGLTERATCIKAAASDSEGVRELFHNPNNCGDHRLNSDPENNPNTKQQKVEKVYSVNLAQRLSPHVQAMPLCDALCWIDTQGHEIQILLTLRPLLKQGMPAVFEFWPYGMEQQNGTFEKLKSAISDLGLNFAHLQNDKIVPITIEEMNALWNDLRSSDTGIPEGASFTNILVYRSAHDDVIAPDEARRIVMTAKCRDSNSIPKIAHAGEVVNQEGISCQLMHNGLKVIAGGYYGEWMRELIAKLKGHHEPQEELVFHEIIKKASNTGLIIELGCYWAYYSLWFLKDQRGRKAIGLEPDPNHMYIANKNAKINSLENQFEVINGLSTAIPTESIYLTTESGANLDLTGYTVKDLMNIANSQNVEILHCDAQGAEIHVVDQVIQLGITQRLRFCIISTHAYEITGDPLTHQKCLDKLQDAGAHIIAEHDVHESFSGDGLIAASFSPLDQDFVVQISCNRYSHSLFPNPTVHLSETLSELEKLRSLQLKTDSVPHKRPKLHKRILEVLRNRL